jgi:hypothetical protein
MTNPAHAAGQSAVAAAVAVDTQGFAAAPPLAHAIGGSLGSALALLLFYPLERGMCAYNIMEGRVSAFGAPVLRVAAGWQVFFTLSLFFSLSFLHSHFYMLYCHSPRTTALCFIHCYCTHAHTQHGSNYKHPRPTQHHHHHNHQPYQQQCVLVSSCLKLIEQLQALVHQQEHRPRYGGGMNSN